MTSTGAKRQGYAATHADTDPRPSRFANQGRDYSAWAARADAEGAALTTGALAHPGCPWTGECHCARDAAPCTCKHLNASHGSYTADGFAGIGNGPCGFGGCDCTAFTPEARA